MTDWIQRWSEGQIGWHRDSVNTRLIEFVDCLQLSPGDTVFVPLCGKSVDMRFFMNQGVKVIGIELSALAIKAFFRENQLSYTHQREGEFEVYQAQDITLYCGDYFALEREHLSQISGVYDRAALVALPLELRAKYVAHLYSIIPNACRILLLTLSYPQQLMSGPPFAVDESEVQRLYGNGFVYQQLQCFNDIDNEPKFQQLGAEYIEKATYCLHMREKNG